MARNNDTVMGQNQLKNQTFLQNSLVVQPNDVLGDSLSWTSREVDCGQSPPVLGSQPSSDGGGETGPARLQTKLAPNGDVPINGVKCGQTPEGTFIF